MPKRTLHGIDMTAPGAVEELLAHHRLTFGAAVMLADDDSEEDDDTEDQENSGSEDEDGDEDDDSEDGEADLGDKGKKALDAMKAKLKVEKAKGRTAAAELAALKAAKANEGKPADEQAIENAKAEARAEALATANRRIIRSEVKSAAAGKLANPALAVKLIDLDELEVDEDGNVDEETIADAIDDLLKENPYLAVQGGTTKFDTSRGKPKAKKQLTQADLKGMSSSAIAKAYDEGRIKG